MPVVYRKPTERPSPELLPFKKQGVLADLEVAQEVENTTLNPRYRCHQCHRLLPTAHLLDLHIEEQHDVYFEAAKERGDKPMYSCYIEECPDKFRTVVERKDHCISAHKFPNNYRFDQEKRKQKEADGMEVDVDVQVTNVKAFTFSNSKQRTFNTRGVKDPLSNVQTIKDALDEIE
ncbi:l-2-k10201 [Drosophila busckii]|uniref:L-2-k10201 n=2 Tax=Drosophila busckii TaxID=30019 RepID=A0A0M3QV54_DROBS|nr:l-2-k10201 [Drosophila busckii]